MDLKKKFGVDPNLALNGVWTQIDSDGTKVLIARSDNKNFAKLLAAKHRDKFAELNTTVLSEEIAQSLYREAFSETVLLGWENLTEDDKPLTYSHAEAYRMITKYPDFYDLILGLASNMNRFLAKTETDTQKNSAIA